VSHKDLQEAVRRFNFWIGVGFALTPVLGFGTAVLFGLIEIRELQRALASGILPGFLILLLTWTLVHFRKFLAPLLAWVTRHPEGVATPPRLYRRFSGFSRDYWGLFLIYALATPTLYFASLHQPLSGATLTTFTHLLIVQVGVAILMGIPGYFIALDQLGRLAGKLDLQKVQVSLKSKMMLLGGCLPLLSYSMLMHYRWLERGTLPLQWLTLWSALAFITLVVTWLSIRSMTQALRPVQEMLGRSGASTHHDLARLRPASTDEIGCLTQTLAKLFRRLGDQESHMRAVVDTAAEGIIVLDGEGNIDTFNAAAEQLFGFLAAEMRAKPLGWLLPNLVDAHGLPPVTATEIETVAIHRNGSVIQVSVRVSELRTSNRRMFTCLVADITKRKSAETQLMSAEARYRDLVETAHDLVWSMDPQGHWIYLNSACQTIYGYAPAEMLHRHVDEFRAPEYAQKSQDMFSTLLHGGELVQCETVHLDRNGKYHHLSFNARVHRDGDGTITHISGTARDISEQKAFQEQLTYQAEHDSLTGIFNRHYFQEELERAVARVARRGAPCALFYIDLDQFKYVNDTLGHAAGDKLLMEISQLLLTHVREGDLLARFGGDEFTVLVYDVQPGDVPTIADHFRVLFEEYKFIYEAKSFNVTCSIGGALIDMSVASADEVMSHADLSCNVAKKRGRNRVHVYNPSDSDKAGMAEDMGWAARVREMLECDQFQLVYQPIAGVKSGRVRDYEVLVRMMCDDGEMILPGGFMPAAERFGLIHSVDRWVVQRAIRHLATLHNQGNDICFSINLSGKAFEDKSLLPLIQDQLDELCLNPSCLTFEITETAAIGNLAAAEKFIHALKEIGCQFALDDFGSGFSSFTYLKHLPVDKLKIDGSFVQGMAQSSVDQAMVQSMNQIAHALGKKTIAEYVESEAVLKLLRKIGVDYAQGNFVGKPREALITAALPPYALASVAES
jgi:diguanylate cyclase (GGDEF)-like protein/PAS domain S-box-containing protein